MKIGVVVPLEADPQTQQVVRYAEMRAFALQAEAAGFDAIWLYDHLLVRSPGRPTEGIWEAWTVFSALAEATSRVELGTLVLCMPFRHPAVLAKMAVTLDEVSNGRVILGLGAGWHQPEYDAFGYPFDHKASRFEEALKIILPLLREGKVDFTGEYYAARECEMHPRGPSHSGPPIWIGAHQPRMLRLIAQYADAFNTVWHRTPEKVEAAWQPMLAACQEVGRDPATLALTAGTFARILAPGETRPEGETGICGEADEVAEAISGFAQVGVKHLVVIVSPGDVTGVERFGKVIERLNKA